MTATDDNIYVLGDHPGVTSVLRIPILPDGALGSPVDDRPMLTGRNAGAAIIHEGNLYVIGGANNSLSPPNLKSVERAAVNSDGSLGEWQTAPSLNVARSQSAIVKTSRYIWAIGGGAESGKAGTIERARLLAGGDIGPWEMVAVEVDPSSSARALLVGSCIFYIGGSSTTGASNRVDCLLLDRNEDITKVVSMNGLTVPRYEPNVFSDDGYLFVTGGAQFEPGPGLKGWKVTERASLAPSP
ncbi:MAG: hypothetical protein IIC24_00660 [Chloroflexi bacterium]|nr:hypothetical protein [Chloroflexota bacterium]